MDVGSTVDLLTN